MRLIFIEIETRRKKNDNVRSILLLNKRSMFKCSSFCCESLTFLL